MSSPPLGVIVAEQTGTGTAAETIGNDTAAARGDTAHIEDYTGTAAADTGGVAEQTGTGTAADGDIRGVSESTVYESAADGDIRGVSESTMYERAADGDIRGVSESTMYERAADGDIRGVSESTMYESAATKDTADSQADAGGEHTPRKPNYNVTEVNDNNTTTNDSVIDKSQSYLKRDDLVRIFRRKESALNISVRDALRTRGDGAKEVILAELNQMIQKSVWTPIHPKTLSEEERSKIIRSSMFLKEKYLANGDFENLKARLVARSEERRVGKECSS